MADAKTASKKSAAKKIGTSAAPKPASKPAASTPFSGLEKPPVDRNAIRAARYPQAAAQEAARKAAQGAKPKTEGTAGPKRQTFTNSVQFHSAVVKPGAKFYGIAATERPQKGARLFAHTHAVLGAFGMFATPAPAVPSGNLVTLIGNTAVSYHLSQRNFERAPNESIRLTQHGRDFFGARLSKGQFDVATANAIADLIVTGKASAASGVSQSAVFSHQP